MPIDKALNLMPEVDIEIESPPALEDAPDVEIELEPDGGATVSLEEKDTDFYANLAEVMDDSDLRRVSSDLLALFEADKSSRDDWEKQYSKGMEMLGFTFEERTKPFKGACGVRHPMLTESIIQFQAQAMKELMPSDGPVRTQVLGKETVDKLQRAERVKEFMNYQITTAMPEYTPEFDQLLFYVGYGGSAFKKVYYDSALDRAASPLLLPDDVYIPYNGSSVMSKCERITQRVHMSINAYRKAVVSGMYLDMATEEEQTSFQTSDIQDAIDKISGLAPSGEEEEVSLLEFHVDYDMPGFEDEDGVKLPYIVTVDETSGKVLAVRRNWDEDNELKTRKEYFVHYTLIQGPGAYGLGFLQLIGGLTKAATASLQQLIDAGTLSNLPGGFKAKGARIMNDDVPIQPGEWRDMDAGGQELAGSMLPLPYKEPSQTLFTLLGFTVEAGKRLAAIYPYDVVGGSRHIKRRDFDGKVDVQPVADPNIFSMSQRITLAQTQLQIAQSAPQMHDMHEAFRRVYQAIGVKDIDALLLPQNQDKPKDPAEENSMSLDGMRLKAFAGQQHDAHLVNHLIFLQSPLVQSMPQTVVNLMKHIMEHIRIKAEETVEAELFMQYGTDPEGMVSGLQREAMIALKEAQFYQEAKQMQEQLAGGGQQQEDPLVKLKEQELQINAQREQARAQEAQARLQLDSQKAQEQVRMEQARIDSQENIADQRTDVALQRVNEMRNRLNATQNRQG
ncbi:MAG: hypothetical protein EBT15_10685 [Betaproteobacteria bacterium]|nr:hypothetical protein [Betaproteobacteria bacterium]